MRTLDWLERWHNRASDTGFVWYPFGFLKPPPDVPIRAARRLKMTVLFGLYYGFFFCLRRWLFSRALTAEGCAESLGISLAVFAVWFNLVTAPLWNRRARRLQTPTGNQAAFR